MDGQAFCFEQKGTLVDHASIFRSFCPMSYMNDFFQSQFHLHIQLISKSQQMQQTKNCNNSP